MRRAWLAIVLWLALPAVAMAQQCHGRFMNPVSDICWSCIFPVSIGGVPVITGGQEDYDTGAPAFCACTTTTGVRVGLNMGFWEPVRVAEVVRHPYCFPMLNGLVIDLGVQAPAHARSGGDGAYGKSSPTSIYQMHWYINPLMFILEVLLDTGCLEQAAFDMAYITELDPLWDDSEATFVLNPDAGLFTSVAASAACAADAVAAMTGFARNELFWCAGAQGKMYPLDGWVGAHVSGIQASVLLMQRFTNKLHREGLMWAANGPAGQCGYYVQPIMDKRAYKYQMVWPSRTTEKIDGRCCYPYGRTTQLWQAGKSYPIGGEDFAYQIFRRRDCCAGAGLP
jgi:conjugal transfer pilus assembly protein TraU